MKFGSQCDSIPKNLNIKINGIKIKRVESTKYLGLVFDSYDFSFDYFLLHAKS